MYQIVVPETVNVSYMLDKSFVMFSQLGHELIHLNILGNNSESVFYYLLNDTTSCDDFTLTPGGSILISQPLNYTRVSYYKLIVAAAYVTRPYETNYVQIDITVLDFPPMFGQSEYNVWVYRNQSVGVPFYSLVTTTNDSFFTLQYEIIRGNKLNTFAIDSTSGQLSIQRSLIYCTTNIYKLTIQVTSGQFVHYVSINISVYDHVLVPLNFTKEIYYYNVTSTLTGRAILFGYVSIMECSLTLSLVNYSIEPNVSLCHVTLTFN